MLKEVQYTEMIKKETRVEKQSFLDFIDGNGFDQLLQFTLKGLYYGIIFFCVPYFIYLVLS